MGSREISAAWLVAAAILGLFGWLELAGVRSGNIPLAADVSVRAPVVGTATGGAAGPALAAEDNLVTGLDGLAAERGEGICSLEQRSLRC